MGSNTTNYEFYKPAEDETGWADNVNDTFDDLDSMLNAHFVVTQSSGSLDNEHVVARPVTGPASSTDNAVVRWDGTSGSVTQDSGVTIDDSDNVGGVTTLTATNVAAHNLTGKLTAGATEIEGSNFDIDGGDISSGSVSGGLTWLAAQNFNDQNLTNVDIDSGDVSAITVSGGLTWSAAQDFNSQNLTNVDIDSGTVDNAVIGGATPLAGTFTQTTVGPGTKCDGFVTKIAEVQTSGSAQTTLTNLTLLDENTYHLKTYVIGVESSGSQRASYEVAATAYRTGAGDATLQGTPTVIHSAESDADWDATFTVDTNDVRVSVAGVTATTIEWGCTLQYLNMSS